MTVTKIPTAWTQAEINEYFNIRLNNIEKFMPNLVLNFENIVPDEDGINASTVLRPQTKIEMIAVTNEIKNKIKPKRS